MVPVRQTRLHCLLPGDYSKMLPPLRHGTVVSDIYSGTRCARDIKQDRTNIFLDYLREFYLTCILARYNQ